MNQRSLLRRPFAYRYYNVTFILIAVNVAVFLLQLLWKQVYIYRNIAYPAVYFFLGLNPELIIGKSFIWQIFTYMFVHGGYLHILFNMLVLFMFGVQLERRMGSTEFLLLYLVTGAGVGLISLALGMNVVGASGAIYGLLLAFATYFPDARIVIFFLLPVRAPVAVLIFAVLSIVFQFTGAFGGVAHFAHLAGIVFGFLYFVVRLGINPIRQFLDRR
jgi:membrane associated rhomboid family serine protease